MNDRPVLTAAEAAEMLGFSADGLRRILARGDIPGRKVGNRWILSRAQIERFIEEGR